jgi:16S rRNA G966 N2-methylase RsmD
VEIITLPTPALGTMEKSYKEQLDLSTEKNNLLALDGFIICEVDKDTIINETEKFEIYKEKNYGIRNVIILKHR